MMEKLLLILIAIKEVETNYHLPLPLSIGNYWVYKHTYYEYCEKDWDKYEFIEDSCYEKAVVTKKVKRVKDIKVNGYLIKGGPLPGIYFYEDGYLWLYSQKEKILMRFFPINPQYGDEWYMYKKAEKTEEDFDEDGVSDSTGVISIARILEEKEDFYKVLIWEYQNCKWYSKEKTWVDFTFPAWGWLTIQMGKGIVEYEKPVRRGLGDSWKIRKYKIED